MLARTAEEAPLLPLSLACRQQPTVRHLASSHSAEAEAPIQPGSSSLLTRSSISSGGCCSSSNSSSSSSSTTGSRGQQRLTCSALASFPPLFIIPRSILPPFSSLECASEAAAAGTAAGGAARTLKGVTRMACMPLLSEDDLCRFRTKSCRRLSSGGCDFGLSRCQYSHNKQWHRRCPVYVSDHSFIRYVHLLCPKVQLLKSSSSSQAAGGEASPQCVSSCERGWECPFAHSREEALYHPLVYKTTLCQRYQRGACSVYYCPYIHSLSEARQPRCYRLPFTSGIDIPPIPNVLVVSHIAKSPKVPFQQGGRCEGTGNSKALTAEGLGDSSSSSRSSPMSRSSKKQQPSSPSSCCSSSEPSEVPRHWRKQDAKRAKMRGSLFNIKIRREALSAWLTNKSETEGEEAQNQWKENFQGILSSPEKEAAHASSPPLLQQHQRKQQQKPGNLMGETCALGLLDANPSPVACDSAATETATAPAAPATAAGAAEVGLEGGAKLNYSGLLGGWPAWAPLAHSQHLCPLELSNFLGRDDWGVCTAQLSFSHPPLALNWTETSRSALRRMHPLLLLLRGFHIPALLKRQRLMAVLVAGVEDVLHRLCNSLQGPCVGHRSSSPALPEIVSSPASSLHEGSISGGDGGAADSDDSTAFSHSPSLAASNPACLLSPPYAASLKRDSSGFLANCMREREGVGAGGGAGEGGGRAFLASSHLEGSAEAEKEFERLERAVNVLCEDWAETDPPTYHREVDLRFGRFEQQQQQQQQQQEQQRQQLEASMEEGESAFSFAPRCTMRPEIQASRHVLPGPHTQAWWGSSVLSLQEAQDGGGS
ncbi:hypothetical protein Esti_002440 [Eimeria stiedai]